ncbi:MAG: sulfatase [Pirellulales bacterium]
MQSKFDLLKFTSAHSSLLTATMFAAVLSCICPAASAAKQKATAKPLNVLLICVDDLRPELGCYGADYAQTPNIDRLAREGVRFTQHFVQVPTCGASRYALLTGRSPASSRVTASNAALYRGRSALSREPTAGAQSLPELFRRNAYRTVCIGKISHTADGRVYEYNGTGDGRDEVPHAWDELSTPFGPWERGWGIFFAYSGGRHREDGRSQSDLMEFRAEQDEDLPDGLLARQAVESLRQMKNRAEPFFLGLGFFKPHLPLVAPRQDWEAFADVEIPPPPHPDKPASDYWHGSGEFFKYDFPFDKQRPLDAEKIAHCRRAYLACVRYTDRQIGRVLDALDETGLADSTIVVLWSDHGWNLGDSRMWAKHTPFERAVRSPLIVRVPGVEDVGSRCDAPVETLDVYPTLVDLCQPSFTRTEHPLDGKSLRPLLEDSRQSVRDAAISYWQDAVTVRTATHRLIARRDGEQFSDVELYDASHDFDPVENLAAAQPDVVKALLKKIPAAGPAVR